MSRPALVFFNEQDAADLAGTFTPDVLAHLKALEAGVAMGMKDLTAERAEVVRGLGEAGIPVTAWLLLPREEGYFATHHNAPRVVAAYERLLDWRAREHLALTGLGLDFEPDIRELDALMARPVRTLGRWLLRRGGAATVEAARADYQRLVDRARRDGFFVETYQFPVVVDDRHLGSRFWQRTLGALVLDVDREVPMLYSSLIGAAGPGLLAAYAPRCEAVGVGSTGGGIDPFPKLTWPELERDLVVAGRHVRTVYVFSLEGCVQQGVLPRLAGVEWGRDTVGSGLPLRLLARAAASAIHGLARFG